MKLKEINEINGERDQFVKSIKIDFTNLTTNTIDKINQYNYDKCLSLLETINDKVIKSPRNEDLLNDYKNYRNKAILDWTRDFLSKEQEMIDRAEDVVMKFIDIEADNILTEVRF